MVVKDHYIIHIIHLFVPLEAQPMGAMVLNLVDSMRGPSMNSIQPWNSRICIVKVTHSSTASHLINCHYGLINVQCNENYIIKSCILFLIPWKYAIHDYDAMFHVHDELEQSLFWDQFNQSPCYNVNLLSGSCMGMDGEDH